MNSNEGSKTEKLTLDDLVVGQKFCSESYTIEASEIKSFATQYDPQPFHLDEHAAKDTFFQGLAASGWHTASITMRLVVHSIPIMGGLIGAGAEVSWTRATRPGDTLRVECEVLKIEPSRTRPTRGMVTVRTVTLNQDSQPVQIMTSRLVVPRR